MRNHRKRVVGAFTLLLTLFLAITLFFSLRPPYSVRQLQLGMACIEQGQYSVAVDYLSDSIRTNPNSSEALFARGRAYQQLGKFQLAFQDYDATYKRAPSPVVTACRGYCLNRINSHKAAIAAYQLALKGGYDSPALLYNNIGYSHALLGQNDDAEKNLERAIQLDGNLQAPRCNMALIFLRRETQGQPIPEKAFIHTAKAIEVGPRTADLYRVVATIYARAATKNPTLIQPAIEYVKKAVELGFSPEAFASNPNYSALQQEPAFREALKSRVTTSNSSKVIQLLDPLTKP
jgi:tetratricopeptide (TPR) repeat protein